MQQAGQQVSGVIPQSQGQPNPQIQNQQQLQQLQQHQQQNQILQNQHLSQNQLQQQLAQQQHQVQQQQQQQQQQHHQLQHQPQNHQGGGGGGQQQHSQIHQGHQLQHQISNQQAGNNNQTNGCNFSDSNTTAMAQENASRLRKLSTWICELRNPEKRENALTELARNRDEDPDLAVLLWQSIFTVQILVQEIMAVYEYMSPPTES